MNAAQFGHMSAEFVKGFVVREILLCVDFAQIATCMNLLKLCKDMCCKIIGVVVWPQFLCALAVLFKMLNLTCKPEDLILVKA